MFEAVDPGVLAAGESVGKGLFEADLLFAGGFFGQFAIRGGPPGETNFVFASRGEFERGRGDGGVLAATLEDGLIGVGVGTQDGHDRLDKFLQFVAQLFDRVFAIGWRRWWWWLRC